MSSSRWPWLAWLLPLVAVPPTACDNSPIEFPQPQPLPTCEGFDVHSGDEATDLATGLRWDTFVELRVLTHVQAKERCAARGKRLPTLAEVSALRRTPAEGDPCGLPACPFQGDRCAIVQCGSEIAGTTAHWGVAFLGDGVVGVPADRPEVSLCVADPLPGFVPPTAAP